MARILVTGAAGFVGRAVCGALMAHGHAVVAGLRRPGAAIGGTAPRVLGEIAADRAWRDAFAGIDVVIHLAQRAHAAARGRLADEPAAAANMARAAAQAGVRRIVYVSSIKAMGEATAPGRPFRPNDPPRPQDAYGEAKLASERALAAAAQAAGIAVAIIRPPLVYGPGVEANFRALMRLAASGWPLPFAALDNRRSLVFLDNLADLVACAAVHPATPGRVLLVRDANLAIPALIRALAAAIGRPVRLFAVPAWAWAPLRPLPAAGKRVARLTGTLEIDDAATRDLLGWAPPTSPEAGLAATARAFATARRPLS